MAEMKCPDCNADISFQEGQPEVKCPYCGKTVAGGASSKEVFLKPQAYARPAADTITMEQYQADLRAWKKQSRIVVGVILAMTVYGAVGFFLNTVYGMKVPWAAAVLEIAWFFSLFSLGIIGRGQPDGSRVEGADLPPPKKLLTVIKFLTIYLIFNAALFGALFAWAVKIDQG